MPATATVQQSEQKILPQGLGPIWEPTRLTETPAPFAGILGLQRKIGNRAISQIIQTKLTVSTPGDFHEQEADRVANQIMDLRTANEATISPAVAGIHRKCGSCAAGNTCESCAEEEKIYRKPLVAMRSAQSESVTGKGKSGNSSPRTGENSAASAAIDSSLGSFDSLAGGDQPLPANVRAFFEPRFNQDFSHVRIHDGVGAAELASSVRARAFTTGRRMVFGAGQYAPHTVEGQRLIAHELVHVVQQQTMAGSPAPLLLQRQASLQTSTSDEGTEASIASGLIVEDEIGPTGLGQMKKSEFLADLQKEICRTAEAAMAGTGRSTKDCPYLEFWFSHYLAKHSQYIERSIRKYAPETARVRTARQYIPLITARVRSGVEIWIQTGKVTGVPEGLSIDSAAATNSSLASGSRKSVQRKGRIGASGSNVSAQAVPGPKEFGQGHGLDWGVKSRMERAFGTAFSGIRLHTDSQAAESAADLDARAFTVGKHITFGAGEYKPGTVIGDALIAHELAHTIQQRDGTSEVALKQAHHEDSGLENDADMSAVSVVMSLWSRGQVALKNISRNALPTLKSGLQLQRCSRSVKQCPRGKSWQVVGKGMGLGPTCLCVWKCLPGGATSSFGSSSGPSISCYPRPCPKPDIEIVDDDYQIESEGRVQDQGSVTGVGGHFTPMTAPAMCGCLPLDIEGGVQSSAPLIPVGFSVTDVAGPLAAAKGNRIVPQQATGGKPVAAEVRPAGGAGKAPVPTTGGGAGTAQTGGGAAAATTVKAPTPPPANQPAAVGGAVKTPSATATAPPTAAPPQPKAIQDILSKNAPARNAEVQKVLQKDIDNYRKNAGIPRVDEPETPDVPVRGGTVAVARTDIKTLDSRPFGGASAEALPASLKGKPGTTGGSTLKPANPVSADHGEHVALENLRTAIDSALQSKVITRQDLVGKSVWVRVEQEPCSSCAGGLTDPKATSGPIRQFSERYPELTIEVRSPRSSRSYFIQGGKPVP